MKPTSKIVAALASALVVLGGIGGPAAAGGVTRWVDDDGQAGPNGCGGATTAAKKVGAAIKAASPGDTIRVCPGTYRGAIKIGKSSLTVVSTSTGGAILLPPASRDTIQDLVTITANRTAFRGFVVRVPAGSLQGGQCALPPIGGIRANASSALLIRDNLIEGDGTPASRRCGLQWGITTEGAVGRIIGNTVRNFVGDGLVLFDSGLSVVDNTVRYEHPGAAVQGSSQGIWLAGGTYLVEDNVVLTAEGTANQMGVGVVVDGRTDARISDNSITRASDGIVVTLDADGVIEDNEVHDGGGDGIGLSRASGAPTSPAMVIRRNVVSGFGDAGIRVPSDSTGHAIRNNDFRGNGGPDCLDWSDPGANTWVDNLGDDADPGTICTSST